MDHRRGPWSDRAAVALIAALGLAMAWWHAAVLVGSPAAPAVALLGTGILFGVAVLLVGAAGWLAVGTTGPETPLRTGGWLGLMVIAFGAVGVLVSLHLDFMLNGFDAGPLVADLVTVGAAVGFLVGLYDARSHRFQAARDAERDRFVSLFDNLPNPAVRYRLEDDAAVVLEANAVFETVFGVPQSAAAERPLGAMIAPDDASEACRRHGADGTDDATERRLVTTDGLRDFQVIVVAYDTAEGFALWIDVTDRKLQVRRLEVLNRVLRHDLRTDASIISGHADLLPDSEVAETIRERALALADRGTAARRAEEALADTTDRRPIDLADLLRRRVADIRADTDATVHTELREVLVSGSTALGMAVDELLENAVEHNDRETPTVWVSVAPAEADADGRFVTVTIADDGPGFPEMERAVFQERAESPLQHSSGLGLWLARWVVTDLGGEVAIEDREPRGSRVRLRLPRAEADTVGADAEATT